MPSLPNAPLPTAMARRPVRAALLPVVVAAALAVPGRAAVAQRGIEVSVGRWLTDAPAALFGFGLSNRLIGPVHYGVGLLHVDDRGPLGDRSQTGGEISLSTQRARGVYGVVAAGLGARYADGQVRAHWSAGLGYAFKIFSPLSVAVEARYRAEDGRIRGFWRLLPTDRRAVTLEARLRLSGGSRVTRAVPPTGEPGPIRVPDPADIEAAAAEGGMSAPSARLAADVVETALSVMGTPYRWGGEGTDGFDCSGLIQYSYGEHGIILPRVSRDQARTGVAVAKNLEALQPGDILTFSASGSGISHVGLYVGDGSFIHSASSGVKLSSLTTGEGDGGWWRARWVGARRVLP